MAKLKGRHFHELMRAEKETCCDPNNEGTRKITYVLRSDMAILRKISYKCKDGFSNSGTYKNIGKAMMGIEKFREHMESAGFTLINK